VQATSPGEQGTEVMPDEHQPRNQGDRAGTRIDIAEANNYVSTTGSEIHQRILGIPEEARKATHPRSVQPLPLPLQPGRANSQANRPCWEMIRPTSSKLTHRAPPPAHRLGRHSQNLQLERTTPAIHRLVPSPHPPSPSPTQTPPQTTPPPPIG